MLEPHHHIFGHNGGVITLFKKEIPPLSSYTVQSRIYTWNDKWLILQHRFVIEGNITACHAFSKIVFKKLSGKTAPPKDVLELCGHNLTDPEIEKRRLHNWETAQHILKLDTVLKDPYTWDSKL
jgi:hypothetical protein